jgi:phosphoribosylformylglycinamidine synthase
MKWMARVEIKLKESILDPQGQAVKGGLNALGYKNVNDVHVGKYMELVIEGVEKRDDIVSQVDEMCQRLLANPVIEDYIFQIEEMEG